MITHRRTALACLLLVGALAVVAAGCGGGSEADVQAAGPNAALVALPSPDAETPVYSGPEDTFVGAVEGTGFFLGISIVDGKAAGYVCDGEIPEVDPANPAAFFSALGTANEQATSAWLKGSVDGDAVTLSADDGSGFTGTVDGDRLAGTVTLADGGSHEVSLGKVSGTTSDGLYRAATSAEDIELTGGWVHVDGQVRGKQTVAIAGEVSTGDDVIGGQVDAEEQPPSGEDPLLFKKRRCAKLAGQLNTLDDAAVDLHAEGHMEAFQEIVDFMRPLQATFDRLGCSTDLLT